MIKLGVEPLKKLDEKSDEESLYNIALTAEQNLAKSSMTLSELKVPTALPDDIKTLSERAKGEISTGLKALGKAELLCTIHCRP